MRSFNYSTFYTHGTGHPHASGESSLRAVSAGCIGGSSPREWGKLTRVAMVSVVMRVIPTRVGKAFGRKPFTTL